jgi:drug/metabolite transporter (DMT)-like permease
VNTESGATAGTRPLARAEGLALVVMTLVGWSSVPLFIKHFSRSIDVWTSNGWRYGFSAMLWAPVLLWGLRWRSLPPGLWRAAVVPSLFNAAGQVCFAWAHYKIDPALLTFGLRVQIVFVTVAAALLFPAERRVIRSPLFIVGLVLVFGGTMATIALDERFGKGATAAGVTLAVLSGFFFACYAISVRHFMHGMNSLQAFAAISQYTAAVILGLMLAFAEPATWRGITLPGLSPALLPAGQVGLLLLSAVIGIALGHVFYYMSIARLGLAVTAGVVQLQPVLVGAASMWVFPNEPPLSAFQWLTGAVAIAGATLILGVQHLRTRGTAPVGAEEPG